MLFVVYNVIQFIHIFNGMTINHLSERKKSAFWIWYIYFSWHDNYDMQFGNMYSHWWNQKTQNDFLSRISHFLHVWFVDISMSLSNHGYTSKIMLGNGLLMVKNRYIDGFILNLAGFNHLFLALSINSLLYILRK